jgi:hypothetical protein
MFLRLFEVGFLLEVTSVTLLNSEYSTEVSMQDHKVTCLVKCDQWRTNVLSIQCSKH